MKISTYWWGATFKPENKEDRELIKKLQEIEIDNRYEDGKWVLEENGYLSLER